MKNTYKIYLDCNLPGTSSVNVINSSWDRDLVCSLKLWTSSVNPCQNETWLGKVNSFYWKFGKYYMFYYCLCFHGISKYIYEENNGKNEALMKRQWSANEALMKKNKKSILWNFCRCFQQVCGFWQLYRWMRHVVHQ